MAEITLVSIFAGLLDRRRKQGKRPPLPLCLALFTLALRAGNPGFLAIGDWLKSYITIRRSLLLLDYKGYSARLTQLFEIEPIYHRNEN